MPFETPTLPTLISRAQNDLGGATALLRSDAEVLARVNAAASYGRYGHQLYIADQILPDTADEETLIRMARIRLRRDRLPAVAASGTALFTGSTSAVLDEGVQMQSEEGLRYRVSESVTLIGPTGVAKLEAAEPGRLGNAPAGTVLKLISPVLGIAERFTVLAPGLEGGTDQEGLESLRARVIRSYKVVAHGGSTDDYQTWALEVPGVTRAWVRRHWMGPGSVGVFIVRDGDINPIPGDEALKQAYDSIEKERPVTAELGVFAPVEEPVQYEIKVVPDSSAVRLAVEAALVDLHQREADLGVVLLWTHIGEAISGAVGEKDHELIYPTSDVTPAANGLLTYGGIQWR